MGNLENMLENQQKEQASTASNQTIGSTLLGKVSTIYKWLGGLYIVIGVIAFLASLSNDKADAAIFGASSFFGGLFTLFGGCIGEAIDDIRNSVKK